VSISRLWLSMLPGLGNPFPTELGIFVAAAVVVAVALTLGTGRAMPDPDDVRPIARYVGAVTILTFFVALFAAFNSAFALTDLIVDHSERAAEVRREQRSSITSITGTTSGLNLPIAETSYDFSSEHNNDANFSAAVASGLVALTAAGACAFHLRKRRRLAFQDPVAVRVERTARLGVCFVTALATAIAITSVAFGIFEIAAPSIAAGGLADVGRAEGISEALSFGMLAVAAAVAFRRSWSRLGLRTATVAVTPDLEIEAPESFD
jgi:hypothetical protein